MTDPAKLTSLAGESEKIDRSLAALDRDRVVPRIWQRDSSLWKEDGETRKKIDNRLGWLTSVETLQGRLSELIAYRDAVVRSGVTDVVLAGMGGSSLCPEVCRKIFGSASGYPALHVLDTTKPSTILRVDRKLDPRTTLYLIASKSGSTLEVDSLYRYFFQQAERRIPGNPGSRFVAITDPGTELEKLAGEKGFSKIFANPPDIGGRFSALSFFGLVPAALIGIDLKRFLGRAAEMAEACRKDSPVDRNPGAYLGAVLASLGKSGRNKVTLIMPRPMNGFGIWLEQLLAESTGKEGMGLVPVEGEEAGSPGDYSNDRLFLYYRMASEPDPELDRKIERIGQSGQPVLAISVPDRYQLPGEMFRWEFATAVAGADWKINPFDEPNVKESKDNTQRLLDGFIRSGKLPDSGRAPEENRIDLSMDSDAGISGSLAGKIDLFLKTKPSGRYVAILAYLDASEEIDALLQRIRMVIRNHYRFATTVGYGPRFLHSTGQLHKGGKEEGVFIQITDEAPEDLAIPGRSFSFGVLNRSQSLGDLEALGRRGLPLLQIHLGRSAADGLKAIASQLERTFKR